jgi:hypothetical protein
MGRRHAYWRSAGLKPDTVSLMSPAELAYQEAVRAISAQAGTIDTLRSNTSTLLGASSVATAFLGAQGVGSHGLHGWGLAATVCFGIVGLCAVAILFPRKQWQLTLDPTAVLRMYKERPPGSEDEVFEDAANSLHECRLHNAARIEILFWSFRAASVVLVGGVLAWIVELSSR